MFIQRNIIDFDVDVDFDVAVAVDADVDFDVDVDVDVDVNQESSLETLHQSDLYFQITFPDQHGVYFSLKADFSVIVYF